MSTNLSEENVEIRSRSWWKKYVDRKQSRYYIIFGEGEGLHLWKCWILSKFSINNQIRMFIGTLIKIGILHCLSFESLLTKICWVLSEKMEYENCLKKRKKDQGWWLLGCSFSRTKNNWFYAEFNVWESNIKEDCN